MATLERRKRADGGTTFRVKWVLGGGRNGTGRAQSESFTSEARALAFKADVEEAGHRWPRGWVKGAGYVAQPLASPTFADVFAAYAELQERRVKLGKLKPYTLHRYRRAYDLHLGPALGQMLFVDIEADDVADWVDTMVEDGAGPKSIRNRHGLLYSIMAFGQQRRRLRADNPCDVSELPELNSLNARQVRFFDHAEWALFRGHLKEDVHILADVMLATGLRWGEVSALRVGDVTFSNSGASAAIHVVRAWSKRAPDDGTPIRQAEFENRSWALGPPKNKRDRFVGLDGSVARALGGAIAAKSKKAYVFTTRSGAPWRYPDFHYDRWMPASKKAEAAGLTKHVTPHMLRHTAVVWAIAEGVRLEEISARLGHGSIQITYDVYGGLLDPNDPAMAQALARAMVNAADVATSAECSPG